MARNKKNTTPVEIEQKEAVKAMENALNGAEQADAVLTYSEQRLQAVNEAVEAYHKRQEEALQAMQDISILDMLTVLASDCDSEMKKVLRKALQERDTDELLTSVFNDVDADVILPIVNKRMKEEYIDNTTPYDALSRGITYSRYVYHDDQLKAKPVSLSCIPALLPKEDKAQFEVFRSSIPAALKEDMLNNSCKATAETLLSMVRLFKDDFAGDIEYSAQHLVAYATRNHDIFSDKAVDANWKELIAVLRMAVNGEQAFVFTKAEARERKVKAMRFTASTIRCW